jgi:hypothetical protein
VTFLCGYYIEGEEELVCPGDLSVRITAAAPEHAAERFAQVEHQADPFDVCHVVVQAPDGALTYWSVRAEVSVDFHVMQVKP